MDVLGASIKLKDLCKAPFAELEMFSVKSWILQVVSQSPAPSQREHFSPPLKSTYFFKIFHTPLYDIPTS